MFHHVLTLQLWGESVRVFCEYFYQTGSIFQTLISSKHKVIKYFWLMKRSKGKHWEVSKSRVMKFQRIHIRLKMEIPSTKKWPEAIFQAQASRYAWSKRSALTSSPPSTSSQQLVWSCSPFFTNSMISQLQVPGNIKIKIKNKHSWEKDKHKRCRESTCVVEFAGFEDERQLLPLVHSADPTVRWEVERRPILQPSAVSTFSLFALVVDQSLSTWRISINITWFLPGRGRLCSCGR